MTLARGAVRGAAWGFATVLAERGVGFIVLGLLLRVVPASVVGLIAIASAISDLARLVANSGAGEQVQASPGDMNVEAAAFWSQFLASLLFMALLFTLAPGFAALYGQPVLAPVLRIMGLNVVLTAFLVVPSARLATQFRFRAVGLISLGSTVAGGAVALPCAFAGHGVAALVAQRMAGGVLYAVVASVAARWVPPRPPSWPVLREGFRFSFPLMQAGLVDYIAVTGYVMLAGLRMPVAVLGEFRIAQRLFEVLQEVAFMPARNVFMPVLVAVRHDPARRFETTRQMLDLLSMVIFFVSAVCGAAARPIVLLMFGARWEAAVPVFAVLTLTAPAAALYSVVNPMLTSAGRTRLVSRYALVNAVTIAVAAWFAAPYGLLALAWALTARGVLGVGLFALAMRQGLEGAVGPVLRLLILPCVALAMARLAAWAALLVFPGQNLLAQLGVGAAVSGGVFALLVLALAPRRMWEMARRLHGALLGAGGG
ncbi:oligosaccharide flippase family protein [Acidocella aromatica]|uniref:O-antigen/teichoic acid export membrane protein n=1 Tax=Acidocella aromatica TaxID=1303579 RepID=A0A840VEM8_9PROT|nr:oligosaccharide flippase family protein [Acidocella aromatica]MBB5374333.1 O-antigen/teichoic acid export membrane protein [Acidocella aromatica]